MRELRSQTAVRRSKIAKERARVNIDIAFNACQKRLAEVMDMLSEEDFDRLTSKGSNREWMNILAPQDRQLLKLVKNFVHVSLKYEALFN